MHYNTKFGKKMLGGLENIICTNINILTLRSDLDPECSNTSFSLDILIYDGVSSDQVWFPGNQQFRKYSTKSHVLIICVIAMTYTLKIAPPHNKKKKKKEERKKKMSA